MVNIILTDEVTTLEHHSRTSVELHFDGSFHVWHMMISVTSNGIFKEHSMYKRAAD